jgi:dTDP-4-amino-4,6-dideoxygalactose transaminase
MKISIQHSQATITQQDIDAVSNQLRTGLVSSGITTNKFIQEVSKRHGYMLGKDAVSGSQALVEVLKLLKVTTGDEVIVSTYVCKEVIQAIMSVGAVPVLHDVDVNWCPLEEHIREKVTAKTKAIVLVHIFGIDASLKFQSEFQVPIIDDLCQAFGLQPEHKSFDAAFFSFNGTKCLTTGEGGAYAFNNLKFHDSDEGDKPRFSLSDLQSSLGISQFLRYGEFLSERKRIAETYLEAFPVHSILNTRSVAANTVWFRFPVTTSLEFEYVKSEFEKFGIAIRRGVDRLNHPQSSASQFPGAEECYRRTISIPIYPFLSERAVEQVCFAANKILTC